MHQLYLGAPSEWAMSGRIGVWPARHSSRRSEYLLDGKDDDVAFKEYLEFGLHEYPEELKRAVVEKVNSLKGRVDAGLPGLWYLPIAEGHHLDDGGAHGDAGRG